MYLNYEEYKSMGGTLTGAAFAAAERRARYTINAQAGGQTGERIKALGTVPDEVKDCIFDLIMLENEKHTAQSESRTQGGISESITYAVKAADELNAEAQEIIYRYLIGVKSGGVSLLYSGGLA